MTALDGTVQLTAAPGTRMEELLASFESAKAARDDAKARYEAVAGALKAEMAAAAPPGSTSITVSGQTPGLPRLRLIWTRPYRFNTERFRTEHPALYVRYEIRGGQWSLRSAE